MGLVIPALVAYMLLQVAVGAWASRFVKTESDYLVAGRSLGLPLVAMSVFATWFGAETVIGSSAAVSAEGLAGGRADPFGYALCLLGMGLFLAYQLRVRNYVTIGDLFRDRFSRATEIAGSLLFIPSLVTWGAAQLLAFAYIITTLTGMGLFHALPLVTGLVILYTWMGGLLGDVVTDFIQGMVLILGLIILCGTVIAAAGGIDVAVSSITADQLRFVAPDESLLARLDIWSVPVLGSLVSQAALARLLAARTPGIARNGAFLGFGLYITVGLVPVFIALTATHLGLDLAGGDRFLPALAETLLPAPLFVIFMGALVSAILSTIDSTFLTISALISHNVVTPAFPRLTERRKVTIARLVLLATGVTALAIAMAQAANSRSIIDILLLADSLGTSGLLVTVLIGLYTTRFGGPAAALTAFALGVLGYPVATGLLGFEAPYLFSLASALAGYLTVALWPRRRPADRSV
ncbi:MAG: sodium:solute symporter [Alphaproteobacteria bacterium]